MLWITHIVTLCLIRDTFYTTFPTISHMQQTIGKRIVDITPIKELYEAQEGEVEHIIGKTGQGKTYEATRRASGFLYSGYTVYTTWRLNLPEFYDEREHFWPVLRNLILFRRSFVQIDLRKNWHYVNLEDYVDDEGIMDTVKLSTFLAKLTDCIFMLDEGQDVFDSHQKSGKIARQTITRTRHMHKTLIIISQRAQAVDVTARGNVTNFYKCEKVSIPFFPPLFRVYKTDEIDESSNYPIWARHDSTGREVWKAQLWHSAFARKWIYDMYDSWYMRKSMIRSQDINIDAFNLSFLDRLHVFFRLFKPRKRDIPTDQDMDIDAPEDDIIMNDETVSGFQGEASAQQSAKVPLSRILRLSPLGTRKQAPRVVNVTHETELPA